MNEYIEEGVLDMFDLPAYVKNKSFAEAADIINKKFKGREDRVAQETKLDMLERLADAQEFIKEMNEQREESMRANAMEVPDMMDGETPAGFEEFTNPVGQVESSVISGQTSTPTGSGPLEGLTPPAMDINTSNDLNNYNDPNTPLQGLRSGETPNMFFLGGLLTEDGRFSDDLTETAGMLSGLVGGNSTPSQFESGKMGEVNTASSTVGGVVEGALDGIKTGNPLLAIGGALKGGISNLIGSKNANREVVRNNRRVDMSGNRQFQNIFKNGGLIDFSKFKLDDDIHSIPRSTPGLTTGIDSRNNVSAVNARKEPRTLRDPMPALDWAGGALGEVLRTAPIVSNILDKPKRISTPRGTRLGNRYEPSYIDREAIAEPIRSSNINRAVTELSGGDASVARANLQGTSLNRDRALANAYLQAEAMNNQERQAAQQFNLNVDNINLQQDERFIERSAQDEAAYQADRANRRAILAEDLAAFGKERLDERTVRDMFGYTRRGKYYVNANGDRLTPSQYKKMINDLGTSSSYTPDMMQRLLQMQLDNYASAKKASKESSKSDSN